MERVPGLSLGLAGEVCNVAARLRTGPFVRPPGVGESISWARALVGLRCSRIDAEMLDHSAARLFSLPEDVKTFRGPPTLPLWSAAASAALPDGTPVAVALRGQRMPGSDWKKVRMGAHSHQRAV